MRIWFINGRSPFSLRRAMDQSINFYEERTIKWNEESNSVKMIDQTLLPTKLAFVECEKVPELVEAIKTMKIRGAPAIGVAGAMGVALAIVASKATTKKDLLKEIEPETELVKSARPTAVNLTWGVNKTLDYLKANLPEQFEHELAGKLVIDFVKRLADADVETNKILSDLGAKLFRSGESVLTHCN